MSQKVLLMGSCEAGKTSIRLLVFSNYTSKDTRTLEATVNAELHQVRFLNLILSIWDCGGQHAFMENYFHSQREYIFKSVKLMVYVFDVISRDVDRDYENFKNCIEALAENSPDAQVCVLVHKMDLLQEMQGKIALYDRREKVSELSGPFKIHCYATSIWDASLYEAWTSIIYYLIPNADKFQEHVIEFGRILDVNEIILFEKVTFLIVAKYLTRIYKNVHRFHDLSIIMKRFKLTCSLFKEEFKGLEVKNSKFALYIEEMSRNTVMLICLPDPNIPSEVNLVNIRNAYHEFSKLDSPRESPSSAGPSPLKSAKEIKSSASHTFVQRKLTSLHLPLKITTQSSEGNPSPVSPGPSTSRESTPSQFPSTSQDPSTSSSLSRSSTQELSQSSGPSTPSKKSGLSSPSTKSPMSADRVKTVRFLDETMQQGQATPTGSPARKTKSGHFSAPRNPESPQSPEHGQSVKSPERKKERFSVEVPLEDRLTLPPSLALELAASASAAASASPTEETLPKPSKK